MMLPKYSLKVIQKAKKLIEEGRVKLDYKGKGAYFTIHGYKEDYDVIINHKGTSCTCKYQIYSPNKICSHALAAYFYYKYKVKKDET